MANNKEEAGKGTPRPGELPGGRRTYAMLDLTASEVEGRTGPSREAASAPSLTAASAASQATSQATPQATSQAKSQAQSQAQPQVQPESSQAKPEPSAAAPAAKHADPARAGHAADSRGDGAPPSKWVRLFATPWLAHLASGALGALVVLILTQLATTERPPARTQEMGDLARRLTDLEAALGTRAGAGLRARIEELGRAIGALGETQAKLARDSKALETKLGSGPELPPELMSRLAKLEEALGAAAADPAAPSGQAAVLSGKLAELDKSLRSAAELARSNVDRFEGELSALRTEAGRASQRLDALRGEIEERLKGAAKAADLGALATSVAALEREVQTWRQSEADRAASANAHATHMLLALELANLKRAVDRGEAYAEELARAKELGGFSANFTALEHYMHEGAPSTQELARSFRKVADAMLDAEAETAHATLMDRLLSGARSIVRVRKTGHAADDMSLEAIISRMEAALKDARLADVLANAKKLPPKAALAGEDWIRKVEARQAVDQAMAEVEAELKASLGGQKSARPEDKR